MADDKESDDTRICPGSSTIPKGTKLANRNRKPKKGKQGASEESKENILPRRNPLRQARLQSKTKGEISTSGPRRPSYTDSDSEDDVLPILSHTKKNNKPCVPTIQEMIRDKKQLEEDNKKLAEVHASLNALKAKIAAFERLPKPKPWEPSDPAMIKDCKHLTPDEIEKSFEKHKSQLSKIFNGEVYHKRHYAFHKGTESGVNMNAPLGLWLFEYKQLEIMVNKMIGVFDPENRPHMWKYFFQVLAPELCMLIFMDTHNMTRDEAVKYLVPLPPPLPPP